MLSLVALAQPLHQLSAMPGPRPHDADDLFQQELDTGHIAPTVPGNQTVSGVSGGPRLQVLLTQDRHHPDEHWTHQLPRLLAPLGVDARLATDADEAVRVTRTVRIHAAIIDLATPGSSAPGAAKLEPPASGLWLLQVLRRLEQTPPTLVVNAALPPKQAQRLLNEALRLGAFAVINRPVQLNTLLASIQRVLQRHHQNNWPQP
ncbi:MAG: hypothetical protein AAF086_10085 [Planctomycetota bacterium]